MDRDALTHGVVGAGSEGDRWQEGCGKAELGEVIGRVVTRCDGRSEKCEPRARYTQGRKATELHFGGVVFTGYKKTAR